MRSTGCAEYGWNTPQFQPPSRSQAPDECFVLFVTDVIRGAKLPTGHLKPQNAGWGAVRLLCTVGK